MGVAVCEQVPVNRWSLDLVFGEERSSKSPECGPYVRDLCP